MNDKFSLYQTDGLWGIIENASDKKQTSIKSYFGSDLIIKRLNEQDQQIDRLKQQLAEKDKEIEDCKRNELYEENMKILAVKNQTQLAIQELEKVKDWLNEPFDEDGCFKIGGDLIDFIDQQINELKGEKDDK